MLYINAPVADPLPDVRPSAYLQWFGLVPSVVSPIVFATRVHCFLSPRERARRRTLQRQRTDGVILSYMVGDHLHDAGTTQPPGTALGPGTLSCEGHGTAITSSDDSSVIAIDNNGLPAAHKRSRHSAFGTSSGCSDDVHENGCSSFYGVYGYGNEWYAHEVDAGPFYTVIEAAIHYNVAAVRRVGRAAYLNFPELQPSGEARGPRPELQRLADLPPEPRRPCKVPAF